MLFFELIQVALVQREVLSHTPSEEEWRQLFSLAEKQAVLGVCFYGVERLHKYGQAPSQNQLFEWIGVSEQIRQQNNLLNKRSAEVSILFANAGFKTCILKGQGNALMYPNPQSRTPGDVDIWIDGTREEINKFVRSRCKEAFEQQHHIDFPIFDDVEVEAHYSPGTLLSPKCNRRFLRYCEEQKAEVMENKVRLPEEAGVVSVPTAEFNVVYQMAHIMIHFFIEGIGLRHFVDYYYVLRANRNNTNITNLFDEFGMLRFARGVMWIEKTCLGLENDYLIVEPDEKRGIVILKEMMAGGNFGHHDERYRSRKKGYLARGVTDGYRLLKLASVFPSESMWKLYRKVENQRWKLR